MNLEDLKKPFPPEAISWRVGSTSADKSKGMALAYIDARDVQDRLDQVCGVDGWQCRYVPMHDKKTVCEIGICVVPAQFISGEQGLGLRNIIPACWIWKADGAGDSDVEAEKGALSDAFKRAAVRWGIGRYLYDLDCPWVALEPAGRSVKIVAGEYARLRQILAKDAPKPSQGDAAGKSAILGSDAEEGVKNWVNEQKVIIASAGALPALTAWLDKNGSTDGTAANWVKLGSGSPLDRLKRKAPDAYDDLKRVYMLKLGTL